jgi:UDP-glucose 4-epimerase
MVLDQAGYRPEVITQPEMPTGPYNRVADNSLAKKLLDWEPRVSFAEGLRRTLEWYFSTKNVEEVRGILDPMLTGRGKSAADHLVLPAAEPLAEPAAEGVSA